LKALLANRELNFVGVGPNRPPKRDILLNNISNKNSNV
jgi:hypothetical protein